MSDVSNASDASDAPDASDASNASDASDAPDRPGTARFLRALRVERNAKVSFALGALLSVALFLGFVYLPGRQYSVALWLALTFVLAVGTGILLTILFTLGSAYRLARTVDEGGVEEKRR